MTGDWVKDEILCILRWIGLVLIMKVQDVRLNFNFVRKFMILFCCTMYYQRL